MNQISRRAGIPDDSDRSDFALAAAEKINASYVGRVLRLTLLAPEIVEAILAGRQPEGATLVGFMAAVPMRWEQQCEGAEGTTGCQTEF